MRQVYSIPSKSQQSYSKELIRLSSTTLNYDANTMTAFLFTGGGQGLSEELLGSLSPDKFAGWLSSLIDPTNMSPEQVPKG